MHIIYVIFMLIIGTSFACVSTKRDVPDKAKQPQPAPVKETCGTATFYKRQYRGVRTANGERYSPQAYTAAHKTLRFGTKVLVTNPENSRSVTVRINDRGPYARGHVLDLSNRAFEEIADPRNGITKVCYHKLNHP